MEAGKKLDFTRQLLPCIYKTCHLTKFGNFKNQSLECLYEARWPTKKVGSLHRANLVVALKSSRLLVGSLKLGHGLQVSKRVQVSLVLKLTEVVGLRQCKGNVVFNGWWVNLLHLETSKNL